MLSIGKQLHQARDARGLSIPDIAFKTRIPASLVRDMENDDLSNFANLIYARSFLKLYSNFLDLDISEYLEQFDTSAISEVTGHEYAQHAGFTRSFSAPMISESPSRAPIISVILGLLLLIGGIITFAKWKSPGKPEPPRPETPAASSPPTLLPLPDPVEENPDTTPPPPAGPPLRAEPLPEEEEISPERESPPASSAVTPSPVN